MKYFLFFLLVLFVAFLSYRVLRVEFYKLRKSLNEGEIHSEFDNEIFKMSKLAYIEAIDLYKMDSIDSTYFFSKYFREGVKVTGSKDYIIIDSLLPYQLESKAYNVDSFYWIGNPSKSYFLYRENDELKLKLKKFKLQQRQKQITYMGKNLIN